MGAARASTPAKIARTPANPAKRSANELLSGSGLGQKFADLAVLASKVESDGACSLPGCSFDFNVFVPIMQRAVIRGFGILPSLLGTRPQAKLQKNAFEAPSIVGSMSLGSG